LNVKNPFKKKEEAEQIIVEDTLTRYYLNSLVNIISDPIKREKSVQISVLDIKNLMCDIDYAKYIINEDQKGRLILTAKDRSKQFILDYYTLTATICVGGLLYDLTPLVTQHSDYHG